MFPPSYFLPQRDPHANPQCLDRFDAGDGWTLWVTGFEERFFPEPHTFVDFELRRIEVNLDHLPRMLVSECRLDIARFRAYVLDMPVLP